MYLVYLDDSSDNADFQVIAALIVPESHFRAIEGYLGSVIDEIVPEDMRPNFEFHASKMFHSRDEFSKFNRDNVLEIFRCCTSIFEATGVKLVYGAVDLRALRRSHYATAQPVDIAFRLCMEGVESFLKENCASHEKVGILICDDTEKQQVKKNIQQAYRAFRGRFRRWEQTGIPHPVSCFHDDIYFGDSAYSVGIQLADICAFIVLRHLEQMEDTEFLYGRIEKHIHSAKIEPSGRISTVRRDDAQLSEGPSRPDQRSLGSGKEGKADPPEEKEKT